MLKSQINNLVDEVLLRVPRPDSEDVIHDVFDAIENNSHWRDEYDSLCGEFTQHTINKMIGRQVKELTDRSVLSRGNKSIQSCLIHTYSKLV